MSKSTVPTKMLSNIKFCRIFPSIGVARVGNSPEYFIGPEVPGEIVEPRGGYKDNEGRIKKQACRFRIYAFDNKGSCLGELTDKHANIVWSTELANKKADWWKFDGTENVQYIFNNGKPKPDPKREENRGMRNATIPDSQRHKLSITPPVCEISGINKTGIPMAGSFLEYTEKVVLGQCRTDSEGRLIFTGGNGKSDSTLGKDGTFLRSYANNDWWFDDVSDGPVKATVKIKDKQIKVKGHSWVVTAPPDFAPHTKNVVTLYDAMLDTAQTNSIAWPPEYGTAPTDFRPSFLNDVYPILTRTAGYKWVSGRAYRAHGTNKLSDLESFELLKILADPKLTSPELLKSESSPQSKVFRHIRNPRLKKDSIEAANQANLSFMPALSGDEGTSTLGSPETWLNLTEKQYRILERWANGDFIDDFPKSERELNAIRFAKKGISDLDLSNQPLALTRSALEACEGGAFFPGIEATSVIRDSKFYSEAFRLSTNAEPGDVTKWMALPWQADFNDCSDNWWPAVRPDDVIEESYFDNIQKEFVELSQNGGLGQVLTRRLKWARGLGIRYGGRNFDRSPTFPEVLEQMSVTEYKEYAQYVINRFIKYYGWSTPRKRTGELDDNYRRRLKSFLLRTIGGNSINIDAIPSKDLKEIRKVRKVIVDYIKNILVLGDAIGNASEYRKAELKRFSDVSDNPPKELGRVFIGVTDVAWRVQNEAADKNEMVEAWPELGIVSKRETPSGELLYVESGRKKYSLLEWRRYFYYLMNIEHYPDFHDKAKEFAEEFLQDARNIMTNPDIDTGGVGPLRTFFKYTRDTFDARLEAIYEANKQGAEAFDPAVNPGIFDTEEKIVERIRQLAPFNQLDGGWLQRITPAGNASKTQALLFQIWMDELGNGDPAQNHANVYTDLMRSAGMYYSNVKTKDYSDNEEIWDDMFSGSTYHTAISLFPETYYPEILGMTLFLEWEANELQRMVDLYEYYGYSSLFYKLHVAIDNTVDGHGAMAKKIVEIYLDEVREDAGEEGVQEHWERIWTGYIAFAFGGIQRWRLHLTQPETPREKVIRLIEKKRHYGSLSHHGKKLGQSRINALFEEPGMFLLELENSDYIVPNDPEASPFMKLLAPDGVMFRVFTEREVSIWEEWIRSLENPLEGKALDSGRSMQELLRKMSGIAVGNSEHAGYSLKGPCPTEKFARGNEKQKFVKETVAWWFKLLRRTPKKGLDKDHHFLCFMHALRNRENGWIVAGKPKESRFVNELMRDGAMGARLRDTRPVLGSIRGAEVIVTWIREGCPDPLPPETEKLKMSFPLGTSTFAKGRDSVMNFSMIMEEMLPLRSSTPVEHAMRSSSTSSNQPTGPRPAMGSIQ